MLLDEAHYRFLWELRARTSAPIYVTSGRRSIEAQARAMLGKLQAGGAQEIRDVYSDAVAEAVLAAPPTEAAWAAALRSLVARGVSPSRHLIGDALDIRNKDLTAAEQADIVTAAQALGARVLVEDAPPHIHIDRIGGTFSAVAQTAVNVYKARPKVWNSVTLGFGAAAGVLLLLLFRRRRTP